MGIIQMFKTLSESMEASNLTIKEFHIAFGDSKRFYHDGNWYSVYRHHNGYYSKVIRL